MPSGGGPNEGNISAFEILKPISRGAYGRVVLAAKRTTRDLYAIKVIRKKDLQRKNQIEHIKTEREVMAHAEHPFVVRLYYSFTSADNLYMVMEFVNGGDLFSLLRNPLHQGAKVPPDDVWDCLRAQVRNLPIGFLPPPSVNAGAISPPSVACPVGFRWQR